MNNQKVTNGDGSSRRTCILVLGMHRSGTSAITRILSYMGAALPQNILGANKGNETGHWEPEKLVPLHDALLSELDSSWDDWLSINLNKLSQERRRYYQNQIKTIIQEEYGRASLLVLKDPRVCKLLPFYSGLLKEINIEIKIVAQFRNPLDVMDSLQIRDGMLSSDAALLWLHYVLFSEKSSRNFERVFVKYDDVVKNWRTCYAAITKHLDANWLYQLDEIEDQVDQFISPKLCHHSHKDEDVLFAPLLRQWVGEAYDALLVLQKNPDSKNAQKRLDDIAEEFEKASPMLGMLKKSICKFYENQIDKTAQQLNIMQKSLAEQSSINLGQQEEIKKIYNSNSWRITKPLRSIKQNLLFLTKKS